jgi:hypothetical protein
MSFDKTLSAIKSQQTFLTVTGELWPEIPLTQDDGQTLLALLFASDIRVCPAPGLHRSHWRYAGAGCFTCDMCRRLLPFVSE